MNAVWICRIVAKSRYRWFGAISKKDPSTNKMDIKYIVLQIYLTYIILNGIYL